MPRAFGRGCRRARSNTFVIRTGQYLCGFDEAPWIRLDHSHIEREVPKSSRRLPAPALSTENGGPFALDPAAKDKDRILEDIFEVAISAPQDVAVERWGSASGSGSTSAPVRSPGDCTGRPDNYSLVDFMSDASIGVNILVPRTLVRRRVRTEYPAVDSPPDLDHCVSFGRYGPLAFAPGHEQRPSRRDACPRDFRAVGFGAVAAPRRRKKRTAGSGHDRWQCH